MVPAGRAPGPTVSPSEQDGLTRQQVVAIKRTAINTIIDVGARLRMDLRAVAGAIVFLHRFYAAKSLVRNDPFLMSVACLYLAGKVEDSPKSVKDVLSASCELRFRDAARRLAHERELYEGLREKVFIAERALLYALNFEFAIDHATVHCIALLNSEPLRAHRDAVHRRDPGRAKSLAQFPFNLINDSLKTEACLHFSGRQIAAACIWLAMKLLKEDTHIFNEHGQLWWVAQGIREEHLEGVQELLQGVYSQNIYGATDSNDLEFQAAGLLSPQQVAAHAAREAKAAAAANGAAGTPAAGAAAAGAAGGQQPAGAAGARQPAAGAAPAVKEEDDYDALLEQL